MISRLRNEKRYLNQLIVKTGLKKKMANNLFKKTVLENTQRSLMSMLDVSPCSVTSDSWSDVFQPLQSCVSNCYDPVMNDIDIFFQEMESKYKDIAR